MPEVRDAVAYLAAIGRKKVGTERFQRMGAQGRSRAARARKAGEEHVRTFKEGGGATFRAGAELIKSGKQEA